MDNERFLSPSQIIRRIGHKTAENKVFFSLFGFNALIYISMSTIAPYLSAYYLSRGVSVANIGILVAIGPIVSLFMQPTWGLLGDRSGKHMVALRVAVCGCSLAVLIYYGFSGFAGFALATAVFAIFNCGIVPLGDTICVKEIVERGYRFSAVRMGGTLGYAISVVLAGRFLRNNPSNLFWLTSILYLVMLAVTFSMPRGGAASVSRRKLDVKEFFRNRKMIFIILFVFAIQTALGFYGGFLGVLVVEMGYDYATLGMLMSISALSEISVLLLIERALRRFKTETMLIFAGFFVVLRLLLTLTGSLGGLVAAQCLGGFTFMVMYYSAVMFMNNNLSSELRGTGMAVLCVVQSGFASLFSNIVGGQLGQIFGLRQTYFIYAVFMLAFNAACIIWLTRRSRRNAA